MEKQITIPEPLFQRLQKHAVPFVDTPLSVVERMVDFFESSNGPRKTSSAESGSTLCTNNFKKLSETKPPDLTHTRVYGEFAGVEFSKWSALMQLSHRQALDALGSFEELAKATHARVKMGKDSKNGYKPLMGKNISLQGVDANHAWQHAFRLARHLKVPIRAVVEWRHNEKAAYPGEQAVLEWQPN